MSQVLMALNMKPNPGVTGYDCSSACTDRGPSDKKQKSLKTRLHDSGVFFPEDEFSPGNVFHLEINLVQSGAKRRLFDKICGCIYMSFLLNECEFP